MRYIRSLLKACAFIIIASPLLPAQERSQPPSIDLQIKKMLSLAKMDGVWQGEAWTITPTGQRVEMTQTERVGPMLGGSIRVVEGRGFDASDTVVFNAFAVISFDTQKDQYAMRSYAQGRQGDFAITVTDEGFSWTIPAGPATIRYTAKIKDGAWLEYGERIVGEQQPVRFFEMSLKRIGDSTWPASDAVPSK